MHKNSNLNLKNTPVIKYDNCRLRISSTIMGRWVHKCQIPKPLFSLNICQIITNEIFFGIKYMERRAFVKIALDMRICPQTWKLFKHLHYVVYIKLANTLHYGKKIMKNWKQTDDFVKYVIYVVVIKICRNVYASSRCYLFYQNP